MLVSVQPKGVPEHHIRNYQGRYAPQKISSVTSVSGTCAVGNDTHKGIVDAVPDCCNHNNERGIFQFHSHNICKECGEIHTDYVTAAAHKNIRITIPNHRQNSINKFALNTYCLFQFFTQR